ncbi:Male-specific lethal 3 -like protein [Halotydeus destructor]|nr:Male-specific lethal 3 -like protein [Halotydeus destructor]
MSNRQAAFKFAFNEGDRVLCYEPDPNKAKVLYDSKVLECRAVRDGPKGKRTAEYRIHFLGWNSSYDRCVAEENILSDTPENRVTQRQFAEEAAQHLKLNKKLKLNKIPAIIKEVLSGGSQDDEDTQDDDDDKVINDFTESSIIDEYEEMEIHTPSENVSEKSPSVHSEVSCEDKLSEIAVNWVPLPDELKSVLERDCIDVSENSVVYELPFETNVKQILKEFKQVVDDKDFAEWVPNYTPRTGVTRAAFNNPQPFPEMPLLVDEFVNSTEIYFNTVLLSHLLYNQAEEEAHAEASKNHSTCCEIYGVIHILRFLVVLPDFIAASVSMPERNAKVVASMFECFTHFLNRNHEKFMH